jgi:hypothetical protein
MTKPCPLSREIMPIGNIVISTGQSSTPCHIRWSVLRVSLIREKFVLSLWTLNDKPYQNPDEIFCGVSCISLLIWRRCAVNGLRLHNTALLSLVLIEETRPPFCTVVHFVYILMDPDPTWKACHQHIRLATNMKFAGVNIYGHPNIWCEDQFVLELNWREIDNFIDF